MNTTTLAAKATDAIATPERFVASPWVRAGGAAVAFVTAGLAASSDDGVVLCPFRRCTGGYCPGCGLTRSAGRLLRGDIAGSWHQHPFLVLAAVQAAVLGVLWGSGARQRSLLRRRLPTLLLANGALLVLIWVVRLALGDIPVPFGG